MSLLMGKGMMHVVTGVTWTGVGEDGRLKVQSDVRLNTFANSNHVGMEHEKQLFQGAGELPGQEEAGGERTP